MFIKNCYIQDPNLNLTLMIQSNNTSTNNKESKSFLNTYKIYIIIAGIITLLIALTLVTIFIIFKLSDGNSSNSSKRTDSKVDPAITTNLIDKEQLKKIKEEKTTILQKAKTHLQKTKDDLLVSNQITENAETLLEDLLLKHPLIIDANLKIKETENTLSSRKDELTQLEKELIKITDDNSKANNNLTEIKSKRDVEITTNVNVNSNNESLLQSEKQVMNAIQSEIDLKNKKIENAIELAILDMRNAEEDFDNANSDDKEIKDRIYRDSLKEYYSKYNDKVFLNLNNLLINKRLEEAKGNVKTAEDALEASVRVINDSKIAYDKLFADTEGLVVSTKSELDAMVTKRDDANQKVGVTESELIKCVSYMNSIVVGEDVTNARADVTSSKETNSDNEDLVKKAEISLQVAEEEERAALDSLTAATAGD